MKFLFKFLGLVIFFSSLDSHHYSFGIYQKENVRGGHGQAAYPCQDVIDVVPFSENNRKYVSVVLADGHGKDGFLMAYTAASYYQHLLKESLCKTTQHPKFEEMVSLDRNDSAMHAMILYNVDTYLNFFYQKNRFTLSGQVEESGTTFNGYVLDQNNAYMFNVGDSRTVIIRNGKIFFATEDHKPEVPAEKERILKSGNLVKNGRAVNRTKTVSYGLSRSFGDAAAQKEGLLVNHPDTVTIKIEEGDFIVTASDGLWDVISSKQVAKYIHFAFEKACQKDPNTILDYSSFCSNIAADLAAEARNLGSSDDITVCVVYVSKGQNY